jgi:hypothetical protein
VVGGSASAAASDTDPRIPAHAIASRGRHPTRRPRWLERRSSALITYGTVNSHTNRTAIAVALIATA